MTDEDIRTTDVSAKNKVKSYADEKRNARPHELQIGDTVLVRQRKTNKLSSYYDCRPYKIICIKGSMITTQLSDHVITRNCSFFKLLAPTTVTSSSTQEKKENKESHYQPGQRAQQLAPPAQQFGPAQKCGPAQQLAPQDQQHAQRAETDTAQTMSNTEVSK